MATGDNDLIIDPMASSGISGDMLFKNNRKAIASDMSEEYKQIMKTS